MKSKIENLQKLQSSPAYGLCILAQAEEIRNGTGSYFELAFDFECQAVIFKYRNQILGVIAWKKLEYKLQCLICQSWVQPEFRGKRIYKRMYRALCVEARKQGCLTIASGIHLTNRRMLAFAKKQGRKQQWVLCEGSL